MKNLFNNINDIPDDYRKIDDRGSCPPKSICSQGKEYTYIGIYERSIPIFAHVDSFWGENADNETITPVYVLSTSLKPPFLTKK